MSLTCNLRTNLNILPFFGILYISYVNYAVSAILSALMLLIMLIDFLKEVMILGDFFNSMCTQSLRNGRW